MTAIAFQTKLKSDTVHLPDVDSLIGKDVIITIVEMEKEKPAPQRRWSYLGATDFNKRMDKINIRGFAND